MLSLQRSLLPRSLPLLLALAPPLLPDSPSLLRSLLLRFALRLLCALRLLPLELRPALVAQRVDRAQLLKNAPLQQKHPPLRLLMTVRRHSGAKLAAAALQRKTLSSAQQ